MAIESTNGASTGRAAERAAIIAAALSLIAEEGYTRTSMTSIALKAGLKPAALHRSFQTKDQILIAFFHDSLEASFNKVQAIDGFEDFSLQEKLHALIETQLEHLLPHREVLGVAVLAIGARALRNSREMSALRRRFEEIIKGYVREAISKGELPDVNVEGLTVRSFTDLHSTIVVYWLRDSSEGFTKTTEFINRSLELLVSTLVMENRLGGMASFLFYPESLGALASRRPVVSALLRKIFDGQRTS
uniref:TetR family transcriptional regulator n=1 Tax=Sorangium cellulosum TaxID=56 RepID=F1B9R3_SORCE|nr:TetR family transcriptional regulator [Sorangium cellulosum]